MDYFNDVITNFLGLERVSCVAVYGGSESSQISLKPLCVLQGLFDPQLMFEEFFFFNSLCLLGFIQKTAFYVKFTL